eukprot:TRINITY_DN46788_c0_g1_i1.p1 TRINITY_DN46788_c0_g1~~TRINITY_DN46788_c0_g1_i1.p1  ORF type:complete len:418 (+),score=61.83 TRINITY_DN46788_c0_g1_i1:46-1254(+)
MATVEFTDHYTALGCSPDSSRAELKRAYHSKLRQCHPDRIGPDKQHTGHILTQALIDAWAVLGAAESRRAYDDMWRRKKQLPASTAESFLEDGNKLLKTAQKLQANVCKDGVDAASKLLAAISKYTEGIKLSPQCHSLLSNRSRCYAMLQDWRRCQKDAQRVVQLKSDFAPSWALLAKSLWNQGLHLSAEQKLCEGLKHLPHNKELLQLQSQFVWPAKDSKDSAGKPDLNLSTCPSSGVPQIHIFERRQSKVHASEVTATSVSASRSPSVSPVVSVASSPNVTPCVSRASSPGPSASRQFEDHLPNLLQSSDDSTCKKDRPVSAVHRRPSAASKIVVEVTPASQAASQNTDPVGARSLRRRPSLSRLAASSALLHVPQAHVSRPSSAVSRPSSAANSRLVRW